MVKTTGLPESPPVADNAAAVPTVPEAGALKLNAWLARAKVTVVWLDEIGL